MKINVGARLRSLTCDTEVIAVRAPDTDLDIRCGGSPMVAKDDDASGEDLVPGLDEGSVIGKRYSDPSGQLELLVTKAGKGSLSVGEDKLQINDPKRLPSSD